jgi:hypothetical protein
LHITLADHPPWRNHWLLIGGSRAVRGPRVLDLYDNPPEDGRVICVDEFGLLLMRTSHWYLAQRRWGIRSHLRLAAVC